MTVRACVPSANRRFLVAHNDCNDIGAVALSRAFADETMNPSALDDAKAIDERLASGEKLGPLAGDPVVIKKQWISLGCHQLTDGKS